MSTDTAATFPAPADVIAEAKARTQAQWRGTGRYPVTVGGYVVGAVQKVPGPGVRWEAYDENGNMLFNNGGGVHYASRTDAVTAVAKTEFSAEAYRQAARDGAFGTAIETEAKADHMARVAVALAELDAEYCACHIDGECPVHGAPDSDQLPPADDRGREFHADAAERAEADDATADGSCPLPGGICDPDVDHDHDPLSPELAAALGEPVFEAGPLTLSDTVQRVCDDIRWTITSDEPVIVDGHSYRAKFVDVDEAYGAVQVLLVPAVPGAGHELWIDLAVMFEHQSLDVRRLGQLVADAMETPGRTAASLQEGETFKLSGTGDGTWHVCAVNMTGGGSVAVYIDDRRDDEAPTVRIDATPDQPVIVAAADTSELVAIIEADQLVRPVPVRVLTDDEKIFNSPEVQRLALIGRKCSIAPIMATQRFDFEGEMSRVDAAAEMLRAERAGLDARAKALREQREQLIKWRLAELTDEQIMADEQLRIWLCRVGQNVDSGYERLHRLADRPTFDCSFADGRDEFHDLPLPSVIASSITDPAALAADLVAWFPVWALGRPDVHISVTDGDCSLYGSYNVTYRPGAQAVLTIMRYRREETVTTGTLPEVMAYVAENLGRSRQGDDD